MEKLRNSYELRKTIRFTLEPKGIQRPYKEPENSDDPGVESFITLYIQLMNDIEKLFYHDKEKQVFQKKVSIKKDWIKTYCKQGYHDKKSSFTHSNKISLGTTDFLKDFFKRWFEENKEYCNILVNARRQPAERKQRRSEYAYYIRKLGTRNNFECIHELFKHSINHKDSDKTIDNIKQKLAECSSLLKGIEKKLLPSKSLGIEIERASLNYYTVNKKLRDYDKELEMEKTERSKPVSIKCPPCVKKFLVDSIKRISGNKKDYKDRTDSYHIFNRTEESRTEKRTIEDDMDEIISDCFKETQNTKWGNLTIDLAYRFLKTYKAMQKLKFDNLIDQGKAYNTVIQQCPLFYCKEEDFNKIKKLKEEIKKTTDEKKLKCLKEKKNKHFNIQKGGSSFTEYKKICETFQKIAKTLGNIKAKEKGIEQAKADAERLQSWALLLEKDNQKYVLTIPRDGKDNLTDAKKHIDGLQEDTNGDWRLYYFESLTLQGLSKLCFGLDKNTFIPSIKHELKQHKDSEIFFTDDKRHSQEKILKRKDQFSDDGKLIRFYQAVLDLQKTGGTLSIRYFKDLENNVVQKEFQSLSDFEQALKKSCYYKRSIAISDTTKENIIKQYKGNFYKITSYDLEKEDKEILSSLERKKQLDRCHPEYHTHIWLDFWTEKNRIYHYDCRMNPELKINFIKNQRDRLTGNIKGALKKNRMESDRYLFSTTITLNANERSSNWSFKNSNEIKSCIETYNKEFNSKINPEAIWYYGLDRGGHELLTLGLFQFSPGDDDTVRPHFIKDLDLYKIKEEKYLEKNQQGNIAYKSVDQFIDDPEVIEKILEPSCIDLSCAKLIKGKIVINGDVATYLKLRETAAKRKIWEGVVNGRFRSDTICFNGERQAFYLSIENKGELENENLYFYDKRFASILPYDEIKKQLQEHLENVHSDEDMSIEKINHLRDAICANAVGIINHLQKTYPGMVVFEDLGIENKQGRKYDDHLGSKIEWKLLRKFQTASLVPPNLRQIMELQSSKTIDQLGTVLYIVTKNTSALCPHCEQPDKDKQDKWRKHAYICKYCSFSTETIEQRKGFVILDTSDSVAAYNIAKKGFKKTMEKRSEVDN